MDVLVRGGGGGWSWMKSGCMGAEAHSRSIAGVFALLLRNSWAVAGEPGAARCSSLPA